MKSKETIIKELVPRKFGKRGTIWSIILLIFIFAGLAAYIDQLRQGQVVTNMRDYALWGVYISSFVFFVATSSVGTVAVAILRLTKNEWRTPIVRIAEIISLAAIIMAGITIIIDMARPDRLLNLFIHARLQSPITWDVIIIPTYMIISFFLLYFPLLPDLKILKDHYKESSPTLSKWYGKLSLKWNGSAAQKALQQKSIRIIAIAIIPLGVILQTVDAWLFSTTYRIGWDSQNLAPYFFTGALVAGLGALVTTIYVLRKVRNLEEHITDFHFDKLGKLLALACLLYLYFNINEYVLPAFKAKQAEDIHLETLFTGSYALMFWSVTIFGLILPIILLMFKKVRSPKGMFIIGIMVVVGSWWKRYVIVTPTLLHPFLPIQGVPESWRHYFPSLHEWLISFGTLAMAIFIIMMLVRFLPIIPIQRTLDEQTNENTDKN